MKRTIIIISVLVLFIITTSCNKKSISFPDYFNELKNGKLVDELTPYNNYGPLRSSVNYGISFDSLDIYIKLESKNDFEIISIIGASSNTDDNLKNSEYIKTKIKSIIELTLKYNIYLFEFSKTRDYLEIFFKIEQFEINTLPEYNPVSNKDSNFSVLVFCKDESYEQSSFYKYFKPIKLDEHWYYYTTYLKILDE